MSWGKFLAAIAAAVAFVGLFLKVSHWHDRAIVADRFDQCVAAAKTPDEALTPCEPTIKARVLVARKAAECEAGLAAKDIYAIRATCSEEVKRVEQLGSSAVADLADTRAQLAAAGSAASAAVARAETRSATQIDRKASNDDVLRSAPRTADGRIRCDAQCLRRLAGD